MMYLTIMKRKPLCVIYISMVALCCQVHSFSQIRVCQNKDCIKQSEDGNLIQMLTDLIPPQEGDKINIESCGCLSNCGKGPNVSIKSDWGVEERVFNNVKDVQTAAAILDVGAGIDSPIALMVAAEMIAQANRTTKQSKKVDLLNKVISSLEVGNQLKSSALSHALLNRADAYLDSNNHQGALDDACRAAEIDDLQGRAYRVKADALEAMDDVLGAIEAVENWARLNPSFTSKAKNDIFRLKTLQ